MQTFVPAARPCARHGLRRNRSVPRQGESRPAYAPLPGETPTCFRRSPSVQLPGGGIGADGVSACCSKCLPLIPFLEYSSDRPVLMIEKFVQMTFPQETARWQTRCPSRTDGTRGNEIPKRNHGTAHALARRARIVLAAAEGLANEEIAAMMTEATVGKRRRRFAERCLDGLRDETRPSAPHRRRPRRRRDSADARGNPAGRHPLEPALHV